MEEIIKNPLVSVIIPTFRRPDTLIRAIGSVLNQTYDNVEVIVVDDNNPDTEGRVLTEQIMSKYIGNQRVIYIKHPHNKNGSAARNTGAFNSKGEYIAFLDDDDEFLPQKIASQVQKMESLPNEYGFCYSKSYSRKPGGNPIESPERREGNLFLEALQRDLHFAAGSNLLIRKGVFLSTGGFDETFVKNQDLELVVKLLRKYKVAYVDVPGLIVNVHLEKRVFDYDKLTRLYLERFKPYIDELNEDDRASVYREINKQLFFNYFRVEHDLRGCVRMLVKKEISLKDAVTYTSSKILTRLRGKIN